MGIPCLARIMMGYKLSFVFLYLVWPIETKKESLPVPRFATEFTFPPRKSKNIEADIDVNTMQKLAEELGTTFTVSCVGKKESGVISTVTCGDGKTMCSNDMCGPGATPVISNNNYCFRSNSPVISNVNKRFRRNSPGCGSFSPMCVPFLDDFCYIFVTIYGSDCSALYDQVFGISLDFCCQCNSVFKTCKCNCCKCLNGAGGTCGQSNCDRFNCPS